MRNAFSIRGQHGWKWPTAIAVLAITIRLLFFAFAPQHPLGDDAVDYMRIARNLMSGIGMVSPPRGETSNVIRQEEPFFIFAAALILFFSGDREDVIVFVQALLSGLSAFLIYLIGRVAAGRRIALIAAIIYALYPPLILESNILGQDAWLILWIISFTWFTHLGAQTRKLIHFVAAAAVFGLSILTKQTILFLPLLLLPAIWIASRKWSHVVAFVVPLALVPILITGPWVWRNWRIHQRQVFLAEEMLRRLPSSMKDLGRHMMTTPVPRTSLSAEHSALRMQMHAILDEMKKKYNADAANIALLKYFVNNYSPFLRGSRSFIGSSGQNEFSPKAMLIVAVGGLRSKWNDPLSLARTFLLPYGNHYVDFYFGRKTYAGHGSVLDKTVAVKVSLIAIHLFLVLAGVLGAFLARGRHLAIAGSVVLYFAVVNIFYSAPLNRFFLPAMPLVFIFSAITCERFFCRACILARHVALR